MNKQYSVNDILECKKDSVGAVFIQGELYEILGKKWINESNTFVYNLYDSHFTAWWLYPSFLEEHFNIFIKSHSDYDYAMGII